MNTAAEADRKVQLEPSWQAVLQQEFTKPYMQELRTFLLQEKQAGKAVYPPGQQIFNALNSTPLPDVKVVLLGQDPYHNPGQAHGLCFSVLPGVTRVQGWPTCRLPSLYSCAEAEPANSATAKVATAQKLRGMITILAHRGRF